jgi:hypothetical protein
VAVTSEADGVTLIVNTITLHCLLLLAGDTRVLHMHLQLAWFASKQWAGLTAACHVAEWLPGARELYHHIKQQHCC